MNRHSRTIQAIKTSVTVPTNYQCLVLALVLMALTACATLPSGKEKVALIDRLVAEQEFGKIEKLLRNIDIRDPEFEALVVRRRAIRPLIAQFEQHTVGRVQTLQAKDQWPEALAELREAQKKLPASERLGQAEDDFYAARAQRITAIQQQIGLLEGQKQTQTFPLVEKILAIHPTDIGSRWQFFQHQRKSEMLAGDLISCGEQALQQQQLDLAEACFNMVRALSVDIDVTAHLVAVEDERQAMKRNALRIAEREALERQRQRKERVFELKKQYRDLAAAGWLAAAKDALVNLRLLTPEDDEVRSWAVELTAKIEQKVIQGISEGQALYSHGQLREALNVWQSVAQLDPENPILQGHIARAERFIEKLQRLDNEPS